MSVEIIEAERTLPYPARELCKLVGDVRAYPQFIPWLKSLKVLSGAPRGADGWEGVTESVVGWRAITERFSTRVLSSPDEGRVNVTLVKGPFRTLENSWRFADTPAGAKVQFSIRYEFKNPVLQRLLTLNRKEAARRIMAAFEAEARRRLSSAGG